MITPGLFQHYKNPLYRVLFMAEWDSGREPVTDELLIVAVGPIGVVPYEPAKLVVFPAPQLTHFHEAVMNARWSGNTNDVAAGDKIVIYVSLSASGRVSARTEKEFEERVDVGMPGANVPHFERVGD